MAPRLSYLASCAPPAEAAAQGGKTLVVRLFLGFGAGMVILYIINTSASDSFLWVMKLAIPQHPGFSWGVTLRGALCSPDAGGHGFDRPCFEKAPVVETLASSLRSCRRG